MREDEESALATLDRRVKSAESEKETAKRAQRKAEKNAEKHSSEAAKHEDRASRLNSRLEHIETELRSARSQNQVMERDLAAIRQAIGEIRMKEILAAGK